MRRLLPLLRFSAAAIVLAISAHAQNTPFSIRVQQPDTVASVPNGANIGVNTPIGRTESLSVTLTYLGVGTASIPLPPELNGSTAFQVVRASGTPANLTAGQAFTLEIQYSPRQAQAVSALLNLAYTETISTSNGELSARGLIQLQFTGTAPEFAVSYIFSDTQNSVVVPSGGTVPFPATAVNATSSAVIAISNRGSGSGQLSSITVSGESFQLLGSPLLPLNIPANSEIRLGVRFQPTSEGVKNGALTITGLGETRTFNLTGPAFRTSFNYELLAADGPRPAVPGAALAIGEMLPGELLTVQLLITNSNPVSVSLPAITVFGVGFGLSEVPTGRTLRPGETVGIFLLAQSDQPGILQGRLRVGDDAFDLRATVSGVQFRYSYSVGASARISVQPGGVIVFPPSPIGSTVDALISVRNNGTARGDVFSISTADLSGVYELSGLPSFPAKLESGESLEFRVRFRPNAAGTANSALRIDGASFVLTGNATALPPLPSYRFTLQSGNVGPLEQPSLGVELVSPYPLPLTGVLTLAQEAASFVNDPSVRFINGATSISFNIPANSTRAIFANGSDATRLQTGSVAGTIFLSSTFSVSGTSLPDSTPQILRLNIPAAAPRLIAASASPGNNTITLTITGMTLTRSLTKLDLTITPIAGVNIERTQFSINLEGESLAWFRNGASAASGGIFALQIPLNLSSSGNNLPLEGSNLIQAIASVEASLSNEVGVSNRLSVQLR